MVWFKWEVVNTSLELLIDLGNMSFVVYDFSSIQWCNWFPVKFWQLITLFNFHIDGIKLTSLSGNTVMAKTCILTFFLGLFYQTYSPGGVIDACFSIFSVMMTPLSKYLLIEPWPKKKTKQMTRTIFTPTLAINFTLPILLL